VRRIVLMGSMGVAMTLPPGLNTVWGYTPGVAQMREVIGLFALTFRDPSVVLDKVKGEPVYLILAMTADKTIRMKPQNLVTGLPIRHLEAVS